MVGSPEEPRNESLADAKIAGRANHNRTRSFESRRDLRTDSNEKSR